MGESFLMNHKRKKKSSLKDDTSGSPGSAYLIAGTMQQGYFGTVPSSALYTGTALASAVGITAGTAQHDNTDWLKFAYEGKILFRPMKAIRNNISWTHLNTAGCVFGTKTVTKNGLTFKVRLMKGSSVNPAITENDSTNTMKYSEWNRLMLPIHEQASNKNWVRPNFVEDDIPNWGIGFTDVDLLTIHSEDNGSYVLCQETAQSNTTQRVVRGGNGVSDSFLVSDLFAQRLFGWAPVLELVQ